MGLRIRVHVATCIYCGELCRQGKQRGSSFLVPERHSDISSDPKSECIIKLAPMCFGCCMPSCPQHRIPSFIQISTSVSDVMFQVGMCRIICKISHPVADSVLIVFG